MTERKYRWEIVNRETNKIAIESLSTFPSYEEAKNDMIGYIGFLKVEKGFHYNYTIYDVDRQF